MTEKTSREAVKAFRARHGLTQNALDELLGFTSGGQAVARWERVGAPYYVTLLIALVDQHGIEIMRQVSARYGCRFVHGDDVLAFRERHRLSGAELDVLFGFSAKGNGRATRRWEDRLGNGAPPYVGIMMGYCDKHGLTTLEGLARGRND